ncbi:MAG: pyridoxine 5'-phosphate synthase [Saprospiraceae bacterium]|nr:pyridoxine 5'-phosphate synthase [Saprospiraceae bacterium]
MCRLSVNINKIALIRNSRGANLPDLCQLAKDCQEFGAQGITVHPRPDERHIRFSDLSELKEVISTEFNIEGYPSDYFIKKVLEIKPHQVTLVPDSPDALTSTTGWDTNLHQELLKKIVGNLKDKGIRVSLFLNPDPTLIESAQRTGTDRIELYTGGYAYNYGIDMSQAITPHIQTANAAIEAHLGLNAGHDLNLDNLEFYYNQIPELLEVSIGHSIICDALYFGLQNTIAMYLNKLQ